MAGKPLGGATRKVILDSTPFGRAVTDWVKALDRPRQDAWIDLIDHARSAGDKSKPSAKWLKLAAERIETAAPTEVAERTAKWLDAFEPGPRNPAPSTDLLKGMIWIASTLDGDAWAPRLGRFCELCYRKVPGVGPANIKLGNACIHALRVMKGGRAAAELVRLRSRIKFNQGRSLLDKAIREAAERSGLSVEDLEEIGLPDFGLRADGSLRCQLGDCVAEIKIHGSDDVKLSWTGTDGKPRQSVPSAVKSDHAAALKELRARVKEIKGLLSGRRWHLESLYLQGRSWALPQWRERYLGHPLLSQLSRRLIWRFDEGDRSLLALPAGDGLVAADGASVAWPGETAEVSLWHPIDASPDQVLAWRRRLAEREITQPFKQAHREVYLLTDAERRTEIYSNRFAAHVLKQHQLNALCQARAWHHSLCGVWDASDGTPTRLLSKHRLMAEFLTSPVEGDLHTEAGVHLYLATDQLRFFDEHDRVLRLAEVPPLAFSEVMRDLDLFVGVASVGNDPAWQDGGPEGRHRDYWSRYSFGDLTETAKTRRGVLETLLPKLKIAERCELEDRFLRVRGTRRGYKIHLGSANILMEPGSQHLCIVRGWDKTAGGRKVHLPFEGDATLSLILSKAFLLAEDDRITDPTILSQIGARP